MPDYSKGKVYRITSGNLTYIGATCEPTLAKRLAQHVVSYKRWKTGKGGCITSFPLIDTGDYEITLIELCPCQSRDELSARERYWVENTVCVNKRVEGRTMKEWYETNKVAILDDKKTYYQVHKDEILDQRKTYYEANQAEKVHKVQVYREANRDMINARRRERYNAQKSLVNTL